MIRTRLTERFALEHPIVLAPMASTSGGALAAAVSGAGGLGLVGGGYCDTGWTLSEMDKAGTQRIGCGFITWKLAENPDLLKSVLDREPAAIFLSFGDPLPFAGAIAVAGVPMICQVQTLKDARRAVEAGAAVIVAQGAEAGGHGERRATMVLVPELADYLADAAPETILLAAGGIADGRGLAAALMLGAEGVVIGSRFWAARESLAHEALVTAAIEATGDMTVRSSVADIARRIDWPARFDLRSLRNDFIARWHDNREGLHAALDCEAARYAAGSQRGDPSVAAAVVGEATGLIHDRPPAADLVARLSAEAEALLCGGWHRGVP